MIYGKCWMFGDNIDTDMIYPAKYMNTADAAEMGKHCMEGFDPAFAAEISQGDVMVAGANFGCGSSREHAPISIRAAGISCVIAKDFARIFYRNAINTGLPIIECPAAVEDAAPGDVFRVDYTTGLVRNETQGKEYTIPPFPEFIQKIMDMGGLIPYIDSKK